MKSREYKKNWTKMFLKTFEEKYTIKLADKVCPSAVLQIKYCPNPTNFKVETEFSFFETISKCSNQQDQWLIIY